MITWQVISYIFAALWFAGVLRWDILSDYDKWKKHIPVNHTKEAVKRGLLLLPTFALLLWPKLATPNTFWYIVAEITVVTGVMFSIWWELFDGWYNKLRGFKWRFNGSVDEDDSVLDRFLYNIGDTWEGILKWGLIITFLLTYILIE